MSRQQESAAIRPDGCDTDAPGPEDGNATSPLSGGVAGPGAILLRSPRARAVAELAFLYGMLPGLADDLWGRLVWLRDHASAFECWHAALVGVPGLTPEACTTFCQRHGLMPSPRALPHSSACAGCGEQLQVRQRLYINSDLGIVCKECA